VPVSCVRVVSIVVLLSLQNIAVSATGETDSLLHEPRTIQGESSPAVTMAEKGMELLLAGTTAHDQNLLSEAEALLQQAIAMQPELPQANMGLSSILMMKPYASMEERREAYQIRSGRAWWHHGKNGRGRGSWIMILPCSCAR